MQTPGKWIVAAFLVLSALQQPVVAAELAGVKLDDSARVAGQDIKLVSAGIRVKAIFKVYVAGLYLSEKKTGTNDILGIAGPRRFTIAMLRDVSSEDFGQSFLSGLNANSDQAEKSKIASQIAKFGEMFAAMGGVKKGDVITLDWIPDSGTLIQLNGKTVSGVLPDIAFYNALLKIWLGDKPVDSSLKQALLNAN